MTNLGQKRRFLKAKIAVALQDELGRQGSRMKVCDPMFGADFGELAAPEPCLAEQKTRFQSRL